MFRSLKRYLHAQPSVDGFSSQRTPLSNKARSGTSYYIVLSDKGNEALFFHRDDYLFYRFCLEANLKRLGIKCHCYSFLPKRIDLLLSPKQFSDVKVLIEQTNEQYSQFIDRRYQTLSARIFGKYKALDASDIAEVTRCYREIESKPVVYGLVTKHEDYSWSSHRFHRFGERDELVTEHWSYLRLGASEESRQNRYRRLFGGESEIS